MPIEKTPVEYYQSYCASQRRVEQWVSDTGQHLQQPQQGGSSQQPEWKGFLEDPGLVTPISMAAPLDKGKSRETDSRGPDLIDRQSSSDRRSGHRVPGALAQSTTTLTALTNSDAQQSRVHQPTNISSSSKRSLDKITRPLSSVNTEPLEGIRPPSDITLSNPIITPSRPRTVESKKIRSSSPPVQLDDLTPRGSSKHSHTKESKHSSSRRPLESSSKTKHSSSSLRKHRERDRPRSRSRSRHRSSRKHADSFALDLSEWTHILVYVPYGIIPLLFAMTTGSTSVSLAAAAIMLAGYFCVDYAKNSSGDHSSRR